MANIPNKVNSESQENMPILSNQDIDSIILSTGKFFLESILEKTLGVNVLYGIYKKFEETQQQKKLEAFLDEIKKDLTRITKLLKTKHGILLFNKSLQVLGSKEFDQEYVKLLAQVIQNISRSDFEALFYECNYVLSQIEKMSVQALLLLNDYDLWPTLNFPSTNFGEQIVGAGWDQDFAKKYASKKSWDKSTTDFVAYTCQELKTLGMVLLKPRNLVLEPMGFKIRTYLKELDKISPM